MIIKLFDGGQIIVDFQKGEAFKKAFADKRNTMFTIDGNLYNRGAIAYTKAGGYTEVDLLPDRKVIEPPRASRQKVTEVREILKRKGIYKTRHPF